jgi:prepilin signal peptidase PulO-like enzyme (type II secretory pathway)
VLKQIITRDVFAVILALVTAGAILFWSAPGNLLLYLFLPIGLLAFWIAQQDLDNFTIPDGAVLALAILGTVERITEGAFSGERVDVVFVWIAIDVVLSGGSLLAVREIYFRRRGQDGIGFGDVKLAAAGGVLVGATAFAWALLAASVAGLLFVAFWRSQRRKFGALDRLAFGALLGPSLWVAWLVHRSGAFTALLL